MDRIRVANNQASHLYLLEPALHMQQQVPVESVLHTAKTLALREESCMTIDGSL
jgi:hypothetical protein